MFQYKFTKQYNNHKENQKFFKWYVSGQNRLNIFNSIPVTQWAESLHDQITLTLPIHYAHYFH